MTRSMSHSRYRTRTKVSITGMTANSTGNARNGIVSSSLTVRLSSPDLWIATSATMRTSATASASDSTHTSSRDCSRCAAEVARRRRSACEVTPATGISTPNRRTNPVGSPWSRPRLRYTAAVMATR